MLEAAQGYAVLDREGKRIGAFVELAGGDRIVIRHDGVLVWHRRLLPIAAVANVIPDQRAVVLLVGERTLADTETPATQTPETSGVAEENPARSDAWQERINRYVGPVEGDADQPDLSRDGAEQEPPPHSEKLRHSIAREEDRHVLFISTPAGYALAEQEGPPPRLGDRIEIPGQAISFLVVKLGTSPLPNDRKSCAYLEPAV